MPLQQLLISWKDHNGALVSVFENLLKRNAFVDCTLAADGQYLKAHKVVLSACSSYFELLFSQESEKNPIVILKDVKFQELEAAVNFMYRGEVEVCEDRLAAFLEVAESLQIKGLGSDGKSQDSRGKSPSRKKSETSVPPKEQCRKEVSFSQSEDTGDSCITVDSDKNSNKSSSHHFLPHRETLSSSPFSSTLVPGSCYSLASASTCCPVGAAMDSDSEKMVNNQCSSHSVSIFPLRDSVPSDVNTVVKSEPVTDVYLDERSNETGRDFNDVTMKEDQEDWEDPNAECDDHASNQDDPGFSVTNVKTEESTSAQAEHISSEDAVLAQDIVGGGGERRAPQFARDFFQEHQPRPDPGPDLTAAPAPGPASGDGPARQGGVPAGSTQCRITTAASRRGRYQCQDCSYSASTPSLLARHQLIHTGGVPAGSAQRGITTATPRGRRYQCLDCGYIASTPSLLARHQLVHTGEKPYKCTACTFATSQQGHLKMHIRIHTGEKPYKCTVCTFATAQKVNLKRHMRIHTGEKPYKCTVCTFAAAQQVNLRTHMRIHSEEKPYKCSVCTFATSQQGHLKMHMRIHTGEKPYKCTVCTFATAQQGHLKSHMRVHPGEKPYKRSVCTYAATRQDILKIHMGKHTA